MIIPLKLSNSLSNPSKRQSIFFLRLISSKEDVILKNLLIFVGLFYVTVEVRRIPHYIKKIKGGIQVMFMKY